MNLSFQKRIALGFLASALVLVLIAFISWRGIDRLERNATLVEHTYEVMNSIKSIEKSMLDIETGGRGFIITNVDSFLQPYQEGGSLIHGQIAHLRQLVSDNPEQEKNLDVLEVLVNSKMNDQEEKIALRRNENDPRKAFDATKVGRGKVLMDEVREQCQRMIAEEQELLRERNLLTDNATHLAVLTMVLSTIAMGILVAALLFYIARTFRDKQRIEDNLKTTLEEIEKLSDENIHRNRLLTGSSELNKILRGENEIGELTQNLLNKLCASLSAGVGALYLYDEKNGALHLEASYAYQDEALKTRKQLKPGESLVGQAALEKRKMVISDIPDDYTSISSGMGKLKPQELLIYPIVYNEKLKGVIEFGFAGKISPEAMEFMNHVEENISISVNSAQVRNRLQELYEETQQQAEELESQQEELRQSNDELSRQTEMLQASEEELRLQQKELQQVNQELEEKAQQLQEKNATVEQARQALIAKADELERNTRYKSEFLANMSHELRTPLNSVLILAKLLMENKPQNLNEKQIEYASVIHRSGNDLLNLINDILDLSKIEAGKVELNIEPIPLSNIDRDIHSLFSELARQKNINFKVERDIYLPETILTDKVRLEQVLRNLLSNAFKFTDSGGMVQVRISMKMDDRVQRPSLKDKELICFAVRDTGIGIPQDKQSLIFEAFRQADGSTSRKYGGTGLGLSISREIVNILGGEIIVESEEGKGSVFSVLLPSTGEATVRREAPSQPEPVIEEKPVAPETLADTTGITPQGEGERTLLIIEDDPVFAGILQNYAHERKYRTLHADRGDKGLALAQQYQPSAILLDIQLPVMDGWEVLKHLKKNPRTSHIPVHIMSALDKQNLGLEMGAVTFMVKPVDPRNLEEAFASISSRIRAGAKSILVIEDDHIQNETIKDLIRSREENVNCISAYSSDDTFEQLSNTHIDCIILDLGLHGESGFEVLERLRSDSNYLNIPVIVYTGKDLSQEEEEKLQRYSDAIILKSARSFDRLLDEIALFIHKLEKATKKESREFSVNMEEVLSQKRVLLVDDDMRNVFALSTALQNYGMEVIPSADGKDCLKKLKESKGTDIVLMDIMMPEMDGYEAIRKIRAQPEHKNLPIIALTAKAMQGDREKCIEAGASDYISKPINIEQLLSLMRVWLYK